MTCSGVRQIRLVADRRLSSTDSLVSSVESLASSRFIKSIKLRVRNEYQTETSRWPLFYSRRHISVGRVVRSFLDSQAMGRADPLSIQNVGENSKERKKDNASEGNEEWWHVPINDRPLSSAWSTSLYTSGSIRVLRNSSPFLSLYLFSK